MVTRRQPGYTFIGSFRQALSPLRDPRNRDADDERTIVVNVYVKQ